MTVHSSALSRSRWPSRAKHVALSLAGAGVLMAAGAGRAAALDRVQVRYGPIGVSASMQDLKAFSEGEPTSSSFRAVLRMLDGYAGISNEGFRTILTQEVNLGMLGIKPNVMYGFIGKKVLERVSQLVYTPYDRGSFYALRGALSLSLADDGKMSAIEVLDNYGPQTLRVDAAGILSSVDEVKELFEQL